MNQVKDILVVGSGIAGLSAACLLARDGLRVTVIEQNWLPGGCVSSYPRKGYIFESGATTLVGLDPGMPLRHLLDETGIHIEAMHLDTPMQVYLSDGAVLTRYQDLELWIQEAERVFGFEGQRPFWEYCYKVSRFVWETSLRQRHFPPSSFSDLVQAARHFAPRQLGFAWLAFRSMEQLLKKHGLDRDQRFVDFVNEQLMITAQNTAPEVNVLFGAAALCYTNYTNYYVPGGLIQLVQPMVDYLESQGGTIVYQHAVEAILPENGHYLVRARRRAETLALRAQRVLSAIPINNTLDLFADEKLKRRYSARLMQSVQLNSAFTMGIVFRKTRRFDCLHHQIHLATPFPHTGSHSIFLSLSHPDDTRRCGADEGIAPVSPPIPAPAPPRIENKAEIEALILQQLEAQGFFRQDEVIFYHSSTPKAWEKWTGRAWGFVGGYPQYMAIKPWQMLDARLDHKGAYLCGDSTYPGQGIPGACLSGIIAYEKMKLDGLGM